MYIVDKLENTEKKTEHNKLGQVSEIACKKN